MLKEAIEFLLELKRPEIVKSNDKDYSTLSLTPLVEPCCETLKVYSLSSFVEYILKNPDNFPKEKIINIVSPTKVNLESTIYGDFKQRERYISADYTSLLPKIEFERYIPLEDFIIMLKTRFVMTENLKDIIKIVGNVQDEDVTNYNDDGITQKVTAKTGIARLDNIALPPKIRLVPYRTFIEIEQPESDFLLRARKKSYGIEFALFEADGGAWKRQAIESIYEYIKLKLNDSENITILN